jgi:hypothetical protein
MQDRLLLSNQQEAAGRTLRMDGLPVILLASSRSEMVAASPSRLSSSFSRRDNFHSFTCRQPGISPRGTGGWTASFSATDSC